MFDTKRSLRAALLASACGFAVTGASAQDAAQDTDDEPVDEIVVTGIRRSIEDSLAVKRDNSSIVEAISAEDIGKLPDVSIADSLARLPGVTAQRVRGRSQGISIRGLGPQFSLALLNGREQVSSGDNRGIEFDQYPAELIAQGIVYKSPDATLAANGIAGAVDLRTVKPLDYSGRQLNASARYVWNDGDQLNPDFGTDGYRFFGSYIDQNADGTLGWSIGATVQSNPVQYTNRELKTNAGQLDRLGITADGVGVTRDRTFGGSDADFDAAVPDGGRFFPDDNPRFGVESRDFERTSIAGALQFEPTDRFRASVDAFYTETEEQGIFRGVETPIASWAGVGIEGVDLGDGPFVDAIRYSNVNPILRTDTLGTEAEIISVGGNVAYDVTERLTLMVDLARSEMDRNDVDYESYAGTGPAGSGERGTLAFGFDDDGEFAVETEIDYADPANVLLTDPGGWGQVGFIREPRFEDELTQLRLEADYELDLGPLASVKVGYLGTGREKSRDDDAFFLRPGEGFTDVIEGDDVGPGAPIPQGAIIGVTDPSSLGLSIVAYDPADLRDDGTYVLEETGATQWVVEEDIDTFYAMVDVDYVLGAVPVRGNFGFQYIMTDQESTGTVGSGVNQIQRTDGDDYDDFLPSLNLTFEPQEDLLIRLAAARTLTRARLDQIANNRDVSFNSQVCADTDGDQRPDELNAGQLNPPAQNCFSIGGGNPFPRPFQSDQVDLSVEKYFSPATAIAIGVFHKDISDWVQGVTRLVDGTELIDLGDFGDFLDENPQLATTNQNRPENVAEGSITGIEVTARVFLGDFYEPLDGFGGSFSYTYADGEITLDGQDLDIPGYSEEVWSGDIYYEKNGVRARVNARHRGEFLSEVLEFDGNLIGAQANGETIVDAQIGYEFDRGPLNGFSVLLEAYNVTNEPFSTFNDLEGGGSFPSRFEEYGRTYNITLAKEF